MATIDLGRIRQVFRGTYNNETAYVPDDLVVFTDTGITSTYICTTATTGNNPSSGGTAHANWAYLAKGVADPIPSQSGQSGKFLTTNGSALSFGAVSAGKILQVVSQAKTDTASNSLATDSWWSYTDTSLRVTLTPSSASNKILLFAQISWSEDSGQWYQFAFEKDGAEIAGTIGDSSGSRKRCTAFTDNQTDNNAGRTIFMSVQVPADNTSSRYYNIALRHTSGTTRTVYLNRTANDGNTQGYGRPISTITAMEVEV